MLSIQDIKKITRNRGGLNMLFLIRERDILSMPSYTPASQYYQGDILLKPGAEAHSIYFTRASTQFSDATNTSKVAGDYYRHSLAFKTPKDRPILRTTADLLRNKRVCCIYKDFNFNFKIVRQLRAKVTLTSSRKGGYSGGSFELTGEAIRPAGFWEYADNAYFSDANPYGIEEPSSGGGGSSGGSGLSAPSRYPFIGVSGSTIALPAGLPTANNRVFVFRGGSLIAFGNGVTRVGDNLQFTWALQNETVEVIVFN